jgi:hypothetical protein
MAEPKNSEGCLELKIIDGNLSSDMNEVVGSSDIALGMAAELACKVGDCTMRCIVQFRGRAAEAAGQPVVTEMLQGECDNPAMLQ